MTATRLVAAPPPEVHMLIPGFTVEEVPVKLPNLNNLRFAPDGSLTALGYNGKVWKLRDTDGDGMEDTATVWWDKAPFTVPVGMSWSTRGLFVSSSGKVSLLKDVDSDGVADTEEVVASGWTEKDVASGNVDATGVTMDAEGNLYFGLLTANYANAYRLKKVKELTASEREWLTVRGKVIPTDPEEEVSLYDLNGQRGTVQKWNAKTRQLETIATGIRVPYQFAFNRAGDLFMTDQEGETWMPNGNPLDELNHIIPGRNYGFPPRHEKWLPDLVSEPPVVGFGPQHQSTCGFVFNEPREAINTVGRGSRRAPSQSGSQGSAGALPYQGVALPAAPAQGLFGPKWWEGDAIVAGQSRGKLWRVRLVKTEHGYVGKEFLIARLSMLTTDVAISPKGDLYVSCHSGLPDWGTGPNGEGKIFRIRYTDPEAPQPVLITATGSEIVQIDFDRPIDPSITNSVVGGVVEYGKNLTAGYHFESLKPPYEVVGRQDALPRGSLRIVSAWLHPWNNAQEQTLMVKTDRPGVEPGSFAFSLAGIKKLGDPGSGSIAYLSYDLGGAQLWVTKESPVERAPRLLKPFVEMYHGSEKANTSVSRFGKLPHPDLEVSRDFLGPFERLMGSTNPAAEKEADLTSIEFRAQLPIDAKELLVRAGSPFKVAIRNGPAINAKKSGKSMWEIVVPANTVGWLGLVKVELEKGGLPARFSYLIEGGKSEFPLGFGSAYSASISTNRVASGEPHNVVLDKPRGDYETGRELFFNEQLQCATCHRIRGEGAGHGPDLSNLTSRDAASVLRDITQPGATINPDYVGYNIVMRNGDEHSGFVRHEGNDRLKVIAAAGQETFVAPTDVAEMRPAGVSLMPEGLLDTLNEMQVTDLLTFLLHEPPKRDLTEARRLIGAPVSEPTRPVAIAQDWRDRRSALRIVLVASKQDHGPGQHDYPAWQKSWRPLLAQAENVTVEDAWLWPTDEQFSAAAALIFYYWNRAWDDTKYAQLDAFQARGGGVVVLHSATIEDKEPEKLAARIGLAAQPGTVKYRHMPFDLKFIDRAHPVLAGLPEQLHFLDEPYWPMIGDRSRIRILANARNVDGEDRPMMWTFERGGGRVFASIAGHYTWTLDDPVFRLIILRGLDWVLHTERFETVALK